MLSDQDRATSLGLALEIALGCTVGVTVAVVPLLALGGMSDMPLPAALSATLAAIHVLREAPDAGSTP